MSDVVLPLASWPAWMQDQHRTFMQQMVDRPGNSAWIGIASVDTMRGTSGRTTLRCRGRVVPFGDEPDDQVFVWEPERTSWAPELWIAPDRDDYRSVYAKFVATYWPGGNIDEVPNHVDHVFPKDPAGLGGLSHVRLLAIPTRSNVSAGTLEKQMKARNVDLGARSKQTRMATPYSLGKAAGYVGYAGLKTVEGRRRIAAGLMKALREAGTSEEIAESGLDEQLLIDTLANLR